MMLPDPPVTPLQEILTALGWSRAYAAARWGVSETTMRYWCTGLNMRGNPCATPENVLDYFRRIKRAVEAVPLQAS